MAERLGRGLQNLVHGFDSRSRLKQKKQAAVCVASPHPAKRDKTSYMGSTPVHA